ncbi:hypothetical protein, partial [Kitasatospora sp. NPDC059800]|uniref:hypothetical protein n=1 Tax=Kitasatospora sp. NPDC059800 TaxID=3346951 RepID=UPI003647C9E1
MEASGRSFPGRRIRRPPAKRSLDEFPTAPVRPAERAAPRPPVLTATFGLVSAAGVLSVLHPALLPMLLLITA